MRRRTPTRLAAIALVAVFGVSACNSQPSAKRVAQDLVKSLPDATDAQRQCMLDVIDGYSKDELEAIGNGALSDDPVKKASAEEELAMFEQDLANCRE